jgi:hypothetical protein
MGEDASTGYLARSTAAMTVAAGQAEGTDLRDHRVWHDNGPSGSPMPPDGYPPLPEPIEYDGFDFWAEHEKDTFAVGWSEVGDSVTSQACVDAVRFHRPTVLRWRVDWDVFERGSRWLPYREPTTRFLSPGSYRDFFAAVRGAGSTLVIQVSTHSLDWGWATTNNELFPGLSWTKPGKAQNYPTNVDASYGVFIRNLVDAALEEGVRPEQLVIGAFDSPDVNHAPFSPRALGRKDLITKESTWSLSAAWANRWTGGCSPRGRWGRLHAVLGDPTSPENRYAGVRWSTSGVGGRQELLTTSADPNRSQISPWLSSALAVGSEVLDVRLSLSHQGWNRDTSPTYPVGLADHLVAEIVTVVETWDKICADQGRPELQILWGETGGTDAGRVDPTPAEAREFRRAHWALAATFGDRFLGTIVRGAADPEGERCPWWTPTYGSEI